MGVTSNAIHKNAIFVIIGAALFRGITQPTFVISYRHYRQHICPVFKIQKSNIIPTELNDILNQVPAARYSRPVTFWVPTVSTYRRLQTTYVRKELPLHGA